MRKLLIMLPAMIVTLLAAIPVADAALISVDLSSQTMHVHSGSGDYDWPISSARSGYATPRGTYGVQRLEAMHYSRKYHNSPMPHSIFFHGGYAIHGTYATASLGAPASHGCIRIAPENAAMLYEIVRSEGARIAISGSSGAEARYARAERRRERMSGYASNGYGRTAEQPLAYAPRYAYPRTVPGLGDWLRAPARAAGWGDDTPDDPSDF